MLVEVYALEDASCILKKTSATLVTAASRAFAKSPDAMERVFSARVREAV